MLPKVRPVILLLISLLAAIVLLIASWSNQATAQTSAAQDMRTMFLNLTRSSAPITILFDKPLVSNESMWTLPDTEANRSIAEVGADYVCFSEPWNHTTRNRCTPFSNIISVSYINP